MGPPHTITSSTLPETESGSYPKCYAPESDMPPIRVPGDFLVMQGILGVDPLLNTIEDPPAELEDLVRAQVRTSATATTSKTSDSQNTRGGTTCFMSTPIQNSFQQWRTNAREDARQKWYHWKSRVPRQQGLHQSHVDECWWRHPGTGCLATFAELPNLLQLGKKVIRPTGSLAPGTPIRGLEIHAMAHNRPANNAMTQNRKLLPIDGKRKLFPWNRRTGTAGEVLMLKFKTKPRRERDYEELGYCVYSIDGYPLLYPGNLDDYASLYMKRWYWRVVGSEGLTVFCNPPDDDASEGSPINQVLIPYGSTVEVKSRKPGKDANEKRLCVTVFLWNTSSSGAPPGYEKIEGWCREFNHREEAIIKPLPCAVPVLFEVVARSGENLTTDSDPISRPHLFAPYHSWVTVTQRAFADRPSKVGDYPERLRVAGCGWISRFAVRKGSVSSVVRVESWDSWFDPDAPEVFHYLFQRNFVSKMENQKQKQKEKEAGVPLDIVIHVDASSPDGDEDCSDVDDD